MVRFGVVLHFGHFSVASDRQSVGSSTLLSSSVQGEKMRIWVALLLFVCLILDQSEAVGLSRYGRSDEPPVRRAVLSRYGRAVLSRYGKRSSPVGGRYGKRSDPGTGEFILCRYTGVLNYVDCMPSE
uniref:Uncharacterized protein n=1 Tax=Plectus sambesii TaxID=2011161 RepID=A0A914UI90_9BILA